jgi:hypothetical protein
MKHVTINNEEWTRCICVWILNTALIQIFIVTCRTGIFFKFIFGRKFLIDRKCPKNDFINTENIEQWLEVGTRTGIILTVFRILWKHMRQMFFECSLILLWVKHICLISHLSQLWMFTSTSVTPRQTNVLRDKCDPTKVYLFLFLCQ